jgi:hypothetical protein
MADAPKPKTIELEWAGTEDLPVSACNVFVAQFTPFEFTLTFGYATPPIILRAEDVDKVSSVQARPVARLSLSPGRMQELIDVLKRNMEQFQQSQVVSETKDKTKH